MPCPASGQISIQDLVDEFGGTAPHSMSEYYRNAGLVPGNNTNVPESGEFKLTDCYSAVNEIQHWSFADESVDDKAIDEISYETTNIYGHGHKAYYASMLDYLSGIETDICDGVEGLKSLEIMIGAYRSARDSRVVHLPLDY